MTVRSCDSPRSATSADSFEAELNRQVEESDLCLVRICGKLSPIRTSGHCTRCLDMSPNWYTPPPVAQTHYDNFMCVTWSDC